MDEKSSSKSSSSSSITTKSNEQSLPISTSSSWTILPAERIEILDNNSSGSGSSSEESSLSAGPLTREQRVEGVGEDEQANARGKLVEEPDTQAEDVSDGISIISDCESTGRISPHPFLREHLNELNFKYDSGHELPLLGNLPEDIAVQQIRERRRVQLELDDALQAETSSPVVRPQSELSQPTQAGYRLPTLVQSGLTAVFYVGATLAILAFIGRLRNPEWQVLGGEKPLAELEQRLVELELQNNLMRAEIDIISKQLQYLSSLAGSGQGQAQAQSQGRRAKTFKAWPGNGNSVDPVDITKADLKRPYKCPDGQYVEIAAMCMENKPHAESLADEIGNVVNDVLQQSQAFHNFEKVTERLGTLAGQKETPSDSPKTFHAHGEKMRPTPLDNNSRGPVPVPVHVPQPTFDSSKERYATKHNHKRQEHSRERNRYKSSEYDSSRRHADKSKEERGKKRHGEHDNDSGSGEWHERMMQHREQSRQRHEQKRNNNWYIERGGSREQIRSGETRRR
ncbi:uncharacterized protein LOC135427397 [Drosophila montana]|uniref:uncharacterized protein LOC135427397 n=1 Tax=Drosophila montana TaxID=40370 RepID=UPI00313B0913